MLKVFNGTKKMINNLKFTIIVLVIIISGCVSKVEILDNKQNIINRPIYVYGLDDHIGTRETVKTKLSSLKFDVVENKSEAEIIADYNCSYYYDVIHYTITKFEFFITDKKNGKILLKYEFYGNTPYSAGGILNKAFKEIEQKLFTVHEGT